MTINTREGGEQDSMPDDRGAASAWHAVDSANASSPHEGGGAAPMDGMAFEREMPELGQYGRPRARAWWIAPLAIMAVVTAGAVWTVHGFLARHEAASHARRDAMLDKPEFGRIFGAEPASASPPVGSPLLALAAHAASAPPTVQVSARPSAPTSVPTSAGSTTPMQKYPQTPAKTRSYYDAPLLTNNAVVAGSTYLQAGVPGAGGAPLVASMSGITANALTSENNPNRSALGQALTPTTTARAVATRSDNRSLTLAQGAKIDCVGDTAFDSSEAGISTCTVTRNVYSDDGRVVLVERGSQINSEYRSNLAPGQTRVFVLAARIRTPNGVTVEIDSPAADALGRMGMSGEVNNHWGERIGAAAMLGLSEDAIGYLSTRNANGSGSVVFENTQQQGSDLATRVLERTINIAPTLTQSQGAEFTIVVARDLDFSSVYGLQAESVR